MQGQPTGAGRRSVRKGTPMKRYMLSIYQPDGAGPGPEVLEPIMRDITALNEEMQAAGAWVFTGGLLPPDTATGVRATGGALITDGPSAGGEGGTRGFH